MLICTHCIAKAEPEHWTTHGFEVTEVDGPFTHIRVDVSFTTTILTVYVGDDHCGACGADFNARGEANREGQQD